MHEYSAQFLFKLWKRLEKSTIGNMPVCDVSRSDIDDFLKSITVYSNSVIEKIYRQLRLAFAIAAEKQIITVNLMMARDMRCPKSEKIDRKVQGLTVDEQKRLVDQLEDERVPFGRNDYRLQLFIALYSGMRMGEINALRAKDIDLKKNVIHVHSTISRGMNYRSFLKESTKTFNGLRDVPISKKLRPYLEEAVKIQKRNPNDLLFYIPPVVLKTWLGHKDIHVTLDTYTDVFREMDHGAVEKLDQYIDAM